MKKITIAQAMTILSIIGEEDSIGLEDNEEVQKAIEVVQLAIELRANEGAIKLTDALVQFPTNQVHDATPTDGGWTAFRL